MTDTRLDAALAARVAETLSAQTKLRGEVQLVAGNVNQVQPMLERAGGMVAMDAGTKAGLLSGLEVRKPKLSRTGFFISPDKRGRTATMYRLDEQSGLRDDAMGPIPVTEPRFCQGGAGLVSTVDDYLRFARLLMGDGSVDGVAVEQLGRIGPQRGAGAAHACASRPAASSQASTAAARLG